MDFEKFCISVVTKLQKEKIQFVLCGGLAAIFYRKELRLTGDLDFLIQKGKNNKELALKILSYFNLQPNLLTIAQLSQQPAMNKKSSPLACIIGRSNHSLNPGIDFLFSVFPWSDKALKRAAFNKLPLFGLEISVITVEDLILAKCTALLSGIHRSKDIDDLISIFDNNLKIDFEYLAGEYETQKICLSKEQEKILPKSLAIINKRLRGQTRAI